MNRNNIALFGVVAFLVIGLGLTALLLMNKNSAPTPSAEAPPPPATKIWVAKQDILPRTLLTASLLKEDTSTTPAPGAITDKNQVLGKMASEVIYRGQAITKDMTTDPLHRVIAANIQIPKPELRGVGIWVDQLQTASGLIDKGDHVDVIVAHRLKVKGASGQEGEIVSGRTIAQDLQVLAVDRSINAPAAAPTPVPGAPAGPPPAPTPPPPPAQPGQKTYHRVVLAATPEIAERLVAANIGGELHLTIRDPAVRDNSLIAEAREYPTQNIDPLVQRVREANVQEALENRRKANDLRWRDIESRAEKKRNPPIKMPDFNINPMQPTILPTPTPEGKEITVVRGTEKTRVLVPR